MQNLIKKKKPKKKLKEKSHQFHFPTLLFKFVSEQPAEAVKSQLHILYLGGGSVFEIKFSMNWEFLLPEGKTALEFRYKKKNWKLISIREIQIERTS